MALPIGKTPTLTGKEAEDFYKKAKANEKKCTPISEIKRDMKRLGILK